MEIVHVASEFAPIAKVGGLGDVTSGLAIAEAKKGHAVSLYLPKYDFLPPLDNLTQIAPDLWSVSFRGVTLFLVDLPDLFSRGTIYGCEDDAKRFLNFCFAVSKHLKTPDVLHLHDWHSAGLVLFLGERKPKTLFTIHNMAFQGVCSASDFDGLPPPDEKLLQDPIDGDALNLYKGAFALADKVTTVSPTYAKEIQTDEGAMGLIKTVLENKKKIHGILNGIDTEVWKAPTKPKSECKQDLQEKLRLPPSDQPLIASVTRIASQKGPDLIVHGIEKTLELGGQFALLGSLCDPTFEESFTEIENPNCSITLAHDEELSRLIFAGADFFLMPSIFEPCGLTQMIALINGTIPIVRATGGLKDTVFDGENGFTFSVPDNKGVEAVIEKAFTLYREDPAALETMRQKGMSADFSWEHAAEHYLETL